VRTFRRVARLAPALTAGWRVTVALALLATLGRIVVPVAVQAVLDDGLSGGHAHLGEIRTYVGLGAAAIALTAVSAMLMNARLFRATESGLAQLRVLTFRHIHDLSMLHQQAERRGGLTSRVTSDVDTVSIFMQFSGIFLVTAGGQLLVATVLMFVYSWQLALLVLASFVPLGLMSKRLQPRLSAAYGLVRRSVGDLLGAVAESVVGAPTIRAYAVEERTAERIDAAVEATRKAQYDAQRLAVGVYIGGESGAALANAFVVVVGVMLGVGGHLSIGRIVAFLFLVTLFIQPVQVLADALNEAQNALAAFARVLEVLDTPTDVADPGAGGTPLPAGPIAVRFDDVRFAYPSGPEVLHGVDLEIPARRRVAVVGETGGGKTTLAKLLTRLMDPTTGTVSLAGVPLDRVPFGSLRSRVVVVPQDGFLFDTTIAANVAYGRTGITDAEVGEAMRELGIGDWLAGLPDGVRTQVGERGESLSVGERQLVALTRAFVADPDLLVLDEATSAVDPATESRIAGALDTLTRGRTSVTVAHRLSTAEAADEVLVVEGGHVVQRGPHAQLLTEGGTYGRLYAAWDAQRSAVTS
jgi:ABC-type multidrug transport system fused ATPase/permease subunit